MGVETRVWQGRRTGGAASFGEDTTLSEQEACTREHWSQLMCGYGTHVSMYIGQDS